VSGELAVQAIKFEVAAVEVKFCNVVTSHGLGSEREVDAKGKTGGNYDGKG
jgi:hypothetical protein